MDLNLFNILLNWSFPSFSYLENDTTMLRKKKYGVSARLIDLFSKENSIVFSIEPVN